MATSNSELPSPMDAPNEASTTQPKATMDDSSGEVPGVSSGDVLSVSPRAAAALTIDAIVEAPNVPLPMPPVMTPPRDSDIGIDRGKPDDELPDNIAQARASPSEALALDDANEVPPPNVSEHIAIVPGEVRTRKAQFCSYAWL